MKFFVVRETFLARNSKQEIPYNKKFVACKAPFAKNSGSHFRYFVALAGIQTDELLPANFLRLRKSFVHLLSIFRGDP